MAPSVEQTPAYHRKNLAATAELSNKHREMLETESGIDLTVIAGRGYWTARNRAQLTDLPKHARRAPTLVMPMYSPDGETVSYQTRPDNPRPDRKTGEPVKYESIKPTIIDVHPDVLDEVRHGDEELWVTEGIKKADALVSHGFPTVGLAGVWMFAVPKNEGGKGELLPCWDHVRLEGRTVNVVYDSDVMTKENVQLSLSRIVATLEERGATVRVVYLPDAEDGSKQGVDDFLANGGTVSELIEMPQEFDPAEYVRIRLFRDERLRVAIQAVRAECEAMPAKTTAECTDKDVMRDHARALERYGKIKSLRQ